jgi:hypothetical protein
MSSPEYIPPQQSGYEIGEPDYSELTPPIQVDDSPPYIPPGQTGMAANDSPPYIPPGQIQCVY